MEITINNKKRILFEEYLFKRVFVFTALIAVFVYLLDFFKGINLSLYADIFIILICVMLFFHLIKSIDTKVVTVCLVMLISLLSNFFLITGELYSSLLFVTLAPLGFFLFFTLKNAMYLTVMHFALSIIVFYYGKMFYDLYGDIDPLTLNFSAFYMALFAFIYHLSMERFHANLEEKNRQKEILLREIHHRMKNSLNVISSILGLELLKHEDEIIREIITKNRLRIETVALVHEILYQFDDFENVDCRTYMQRLGNVVLSMHEKHVRLQINERDMALPYDVVIKFGIITNELLTNSIKHGFDGAGEVYIDIEKTGNKITYFYKDNGRGVEDIDKMLSNGSLGLKLVRLVSRQLDADLRVNNDRGLQYNMEFTI